MEKLNISMDIMKYMVWVVEIVAAEFFQNDKATAYHTLKNSDNWTYEETLDKFYASKVCKGLSDKRTGMFTFAPREIVELFEQEVGMAK